MVPACHAPRLERTLDPRGGLSVGLALPIVLTNVLWMFVGTVDIAMLGRYGDEASPPPPSRASGCMTQMLGMGLVMGMDPMVTQGHGACDREALGRALQRGVIVALLASVLVVALRFLTEEFLGLGAPARPRRPATAQRTPCPSTSTPSSAWQRRPRSTP